VLGGTLRAKGRRDAQTLVGWRESNSQSLGRVCGQTLTNAPRLDYSPSAFSASDNFAASTLIGVVGSGAGACGEI